MNNAYIVNKSYYCTKKVNISQFAIYICRKMTGLFAKKAEDALRVLLVSYPKTWTLRDLAREAGIALGHASKVSKTLIKERLALRDSTRSNLRLMNPSDLLKRWATFNNFVANTTFLEYYTQEEDMSKFLDKFKNNTGKEYAITGLAGALLFAPFVRPTNVHVYVHTEKDAIEWGKMLNLMPIEENGNVKFAIAKSKGIFYGAKEINGVNVVSDIQSVC